MSVTNSMVIRWLQRVVDGLRERPSASGAESLLCAYAAAAERTGFDRDLVDRIQVVAAWGEPFGASAARELQAVIDEALQRYGG